MCVLRNHYIFYNSLAITEIKDEFVAEVITLGIVGAGMSNR